MNENQVSKDFLVLVFVVAANHSNLVNVVLVTVAHLQYDMLLLRFHFGLLLIVNRQLRCCFNDCLQILDAFHSKMLQELDGSLLMIGQKSVALFVVARQRIQIFFEFEISFRFQFLNIYIFKSID